MNNPLLSICIPTWNRCELLELLLRNLEKELKGIDHFVEIVVSDNASTDCTTEIIDRSPVKVVYGRHKKTVSFAKNLLHATTMLAKGEFVWVVGDDDLFLPGGIKRVIHSLQTAGDLDYHYANFGWIDVEVRAKVVNDLQGIPPASTLERLQCDDRNWRRLERIEDLAFLPGYNPSALFSGIFCFIVRRQYYLQYSHTISPTDSLDGSSTELSDAFPHAMITLPHLAGRPIAYIGEPTVMQGINGWAWQAHAAKTMIRSTYDLLIWLNSTKFAEDARHRLRASYAEMAGRLLAKMLLFPELNIGLDLVLKKAIPSVATEYGFWENFISVARYEIKLTSDKEILSTHIRLALASEPHPSIGIWGYSRFYTDLFGNDTDKQQLIRWVGDSNNCLEGIIAQNTNIRITPTETLRNAPINILVLAVREDYVNELIERSRTMLPRNVRIISVLGIDSCFSQNG